MLYLQCLHISGPVSNTILDNWLRVLLNFQISDWCVNREGFLGAKRQGVNTPEFAFWKRFPQIGRILQELLGGFAGS